MTNRKVIRLATLNAHLFRGPILKERRSKFIQFGRIVKDNRRLVSEYRRRVKEWLSEDTFDIVGMQEVFQSFRFFTKGVRKKVFEGTGFETVIPHGIGAQVHFFNYIFENVLLSKLPLAESATVNNCNFPLPFRIYLVVKSGFTLAPVRFNGKTILVGNTHLHASSVSKREEQVTYIVRAIQDMQVVYGKEVPILFMGDFNTVPKGAQTFGFLTGDDDNYEGDGTLKFLKELVGLGSYPANDDPDLYTYPAGIDEFQPDPRCRTLDYILYSKHWEVINYKVLKVFLSDHYPVAGTFRLK
ncbi:MAG: endonuclease/exonuclease/phosphatase family protein [Candidatus Magasanikbacteria bacterium]|nr:endonuclease/exonuclease/phosphatase family protein [Candidatus Magasanikbacteria bacterium]